MQKGTVKIVDKKELAAIIYEMRLNLISIKINSDAIRDKIFDDYNEDEDITIYELSRMFRRKPLECKEDTLILARYLIEPRKNQTLPYHKMATEKIGAILTQLNALIGEYEIITNESESNGLKKITEVIVYIIIEI